MNQRNVKVKKFVLNEKRSFQGDDQTMRFSKLCGQKNRLKKVTKVFPSIFNVLICN